MNLTEEDKVKLRSPDTIHIDLSSKDITDEDLIEILKLIPQDSALKNINLSDNLLTDSSITMEFLEFLEDHSSLVEINFNGNNISDRRKRRVNKVLQENLREQALSKPLPPVVGTTRMPTSPGLPSQFFSPPTRSRTYSDAVAPVSSNGNLRTSPGYSIGSPAFSPMAGPSRISSRSEGFESEGNCAQTSIDDFDLLEARRDSKSIGQIIQAFVDAWNDLTRNPSTCIRYMAEEGLVHEEELQKKCNNQEEIKSSDFEKSKEFFRTILRNEKKLSDISHSVSEVNQVSNGEIVLEMKTFSPIELVKNVCKVEEAGANKHIHFHVNIPKRNLKLKGGEDWLRSSLQTLLSSAIKNTSEKGSIEVILLLEPKRSKMLNSVSMSITVKNTGVRFTKEEINRFENASIENYLNKNFSEEAMALLRVREMMKVMKGKMTIAIEEDKITSISLEVNLDSVQKQKKKRKVEPYQFSCKPEEKTILVVDDDAVIRRTMEERLTKQGFNVVFAENAKQALDLIEESITGNKIYDLILMDKKMPGMSGIKATRAIKEKEQYKNVPIILVSANCGEIPSEKKSMFDFALSKNVKNEELYATIDTAIQNRPAQKRLSPR